jgi:DNA polymerase-3 subunit beta
MKIKSKLLRAAQVCQAKDDCREYLNGIHIKGNHVESTDGHTCVRMTMDKVIDVERIVNIRGKVPVKAISSIFEIGEVEAIVKHYDQFCELISVQVVDVIEGKYPDFDRVIPKDDKKASVSEIGVNPDYVGRFSKMFTVAGICHAKVELFGINNAIKMTSLNAIINEEYGNPVFAVMPIRLKD